jgi:hypothetical protein
MIIYFKIIDWHYIPLNDYMNKSGSLVSFLEPYSFLRRALRLFLNIAEVGRRLITPLILPLRSPRLLILNSINFITLSILSQLSELHLIAFLKALAIILPVLLLNLYVQLNLFKLEILIRLLTLLILALNRGLIIIGSVHDLLMALPLIKTFTPLVNISFILVNFLLSLYFVPL